MKYRRYYQRVLKDRLTALRKVRHAAKCHAGGALENACGMSAQGGTRPLAAFLTNMSVDGTLAPLTNSRQGFPTLK